VSCRGVRQGGRVEGLQHVTEAWGPGQQCEAFGGTWPGTVRKGGPAGDCEEGGTCWGLLRRKGGPAGTVRKGGPCWDC